MQKTLFFFVLLITVSLQSFTPSDYNVKELEPAEFIVTYSLSYQQDSLPPHFTRQEDQLLFIGKHVSMYLSRNAYNFEKNTRNLNLGAELQEYLYTRPAIPHNLIRIYKNLPKGKLTFTDYVSPNNFKFEETLNLFDWELSGDTATIHGYKVQKAACDFGGRSWVAWFCPEIPYSDGPYKFNGLPGLILNVHDTRNHYVFEFLSIEKPKEELMIEYLERDFVETTKQNYFKALDAFNANLATWVKDGGAGSEAQQNAARISKKRNNPIELIRK
ncbi:MAG: GLPGLI family protein [Sphingobacteriia bacterium]|nr:GLPGLI family protein [Sphingobacteriia bacterium]